MKQDVDCLIVGAGPAGLTAAIYLARLRAQAERHGVTVKPGLVDSLNPEAGGFLAHRARLGLRP